MDEEKELSGVALEWARNAQRIEMFGEAYTITCYVRCHKCQRQTEQLGEQAMNRHGWDAPVYIWQGDGWLQTQYCPRHARWWTLRYWARRFEWRLGKVTHHLSPGFSSCYRCQTNWDYVHGHATDYKLGHACFPLCEKCWGELTPRARLPFYRQLFEAWVSDGCTDRDWAEIESAVLSEGEEWPEVVI